MFNKIGRGFRELGKLIRIRKELDQLRTQIVGAQGTTEGLLVDLAMLSLEERASLRYRNSSIFLETNNPVAISSADHIAPRGTAVDMTRSPAFVSFCQRIAGERVSYLDLGCSGGGIVLDFVLRGTVAIGLEGSDFSKRVLRGAWRLIPSNLFTCDICAPFKLTEGGQVRQFDVVGAWEVLEHIPEHLLSGLLKNVVAHMGDRSLFMASVAMFPDEDKEMGISWHVTVKPRDWWMDKFRQAGLVPASLPFDSLDMPRGSGLYSHDWSAIKAPHLGFHVILRRSDVLPAAAAG